MNIYDKTTVIQGLMMAALAVQGATPVVAGDQAWTYRYNTSGQVLSVDGPRTDISDVTNYIYDAAGNLAIITNPLGHTVRLQNYNNRGQAGLIIDANGVETRLVYNVMGRLSSMTIIDPGGSTALDAISRYTYDLEGQLLSTTLPNGTVLYNEYDAAHRLTAVSNNSGERIDYTLDAAGNRLEEITGSGATGVTRSMTLAYDELNRLILLTGAAGQSTTYTYDRNGNATATTDGNANTTVQGHDALDQLAHTLAPLNHNVTYLNDAQGNLTQVTDPKGLTTHYNYDGHNNLLELRSPDTGVSTYGYDEANNRISQIDAKGVTSTYSYDAINRLLSVDYPNANLNIHYTYDEGAFGKGHLTSITDASGTTVIEYDHRGNIIYQGLDTGNSSLGVSYQYNTTSQLMQIVYPSGRVVDYSRGADGLITGASTTTADGSQVLASNADYLPFGPMSTLTYGNGTQLSASYDLDYRTWQLTHGTHRDSQYSYDGANNVSTISDSFNSSADQIFAYDALNRLGTASGSYGGLSYNYDENGNRISYTDNTGVDNYNYDAVSHRLLSNNEWTYQYDESGNRLSRLSNDGSGDGLLYIYDDDNRLVEVAQRKTIGAEQIDTSLAQYRYNANGQRIRKTTTVRAMHYVYSKSGLLLAEVDDSGTTHREYIYLNGQPLAAAYYTYTPGTETSGPETIMDDGGPGTSSSGNWANTRKKKNAYNDYYSLSNNIGSTYRYTPSGLNKANYEVYAWWPRTKKNNQTAQFTIAHNGQNSTSVQNQAVSGKRWTLLGKYSFSGDGSEYIELSDVGGKTAADGIRLVEKIPAPLPTPTTEMYYIHNDHLGTPQVFTDQSKTVVWNANYKPFGEVAVSIETIVSNLRFPGQYFDEESGLHQNYFRDYDPGLGRYIQSDPIGLASGLNTYAYVGGNPLKYVDPLGLRFPRPNPWNQFQSSMAGRGLSSSQMSSIYRQIQLNRMGEFSNSELHEALESLPDRSSEVIFGPVTCTSFGNCVVQVQVCDCVNPSQPSSTTSQICPINNDVMRPLPQDDPYCTCWTETRIVAQ